MPGRILLLVLLVWLWKTPVYATDTLWLYFPTGVSKLQPQSLKTLDSALYYTVLTRDSALELLGYTDFVGSTASNQTLSAARAEAVKTYLLQNGFLVERLIRTTAKGELPAGAQQPQNGIALHRRVDVIVGGKTARESFSGNPPPTPAAIPLLPRPTAPTLTTEALGLPEIVAQTPVGSSFRLAKIYFPAGRHVMNEASQSELDALLEVLKTQPSLKIRVEGHVCCIDTNKVRDALDEQTHEYRLSGNRARYVAQYLIRGGIAAARVSHAGFGKRYALVYYESTAEEAAANRRVEIRILEK